MFVLRFYKFLTILLFNVAPIFISNKLQENLIFKFHHNSMYVFYKIMCKHGGNIESENICKFSSRNNKQYMLVHSN